MASTSAMEHPGDEGTIEVELSGRGRSRYLIVTHIKSLEAFERVEQELFRIAGNRKKKLHQDDFPWEHVFASGYGPGIRVQGTSDYDYYLTVDAVYSLFRYDVLLQNPELVVRRLIDKARQERGSKMAQRVLATIKKLLAKVLQLDGPEHIYLESDGIYVRGSTGKVGLPALADGFRGTVTWVLDLVSWWFLYHRKGKSEQLLDVHGTVLIDEIEQHLHPRWQRNIIRLLKDSFPHVQFIATTHSPLVASGCEGIPVHRLAHGEHSIEYPFGWLAEDVYRMMGGFDESSRADLFHDDVLDRFRELDLKRLRGRATGAQLSELRLLEKRLSQLPEADPVRVSIGMETIRRLLKTPTIRPRVKSEKRDKSDAQR